MKKVILQLLFVVTVLFGSVASNGQTMITLAGNGAAGYGGDGGPAVAATLNHPAGVITDISNNFYICDRDNSCLRKVSSTTGTINTIAGMPLIVGYSGDSGAATAAAIAYPTNITIDMAGNIVFVDSGNSCLRKVSSTTGTINTIAGNHSLGAGYSGDGIAATDAQISNNCGLAFDAAGNLYIADGGNHCIRKVIAATGIITTIAGTPGVSGFFGDGGPATAAKFDNPNALTVDTSGNVFIVDNQNSCLRKVSSTTGTITTIAGVPTVSGFSGDGAAATAAHLNAPTGIAVNDSGKIFLTDKNNNRIRVIKLDGTIKTVCGLDTPGFNGDGLCTTRALNAPIGLCLNTSGNCYMSDQFNNRIRKIDYTLGTINDDVPKSEVTLFPNPSNGFFNLQIKTKTTEEINIIVTNLVGEQVVSLASITNSPIEMKLDVPDGIYFLKANSPTGSWTKKISVTHK
jgi:sugar lactone lactonase YvrE